MREIYLKSKLLIKARFIKNKISKKYSLGRNRTSIPGFRVPCDNHYTTRDFEFSNNLDYTKSY